MNVVLQEMLVWASTEGSLGFGCSTLIVWKQSPACICASGSSASGPHINYRGWVHHEDLAALQHWTLNPL